MPNPTDCRRDRRCNYPPNSARVEYQEVHQELLSVSLPCYLTRIAILPVWCMIYDDLNYEHEANIFANQMKFVKSLQPIEVFKANLEAGSDDQLIIRDLIESYGLTIGTKKGPGIICAITCVRNVMTSDDSQQLIIFSNRSVDLVGIPLLMGFALIRLLSQQCHDLLV